MKGSWFWNHKNVCILLKTSHLLFGIWWILGSPPFFLIVFLVPLTHLLLDYPSRRTGPQKEENIRAHWNWRPPRVSHMSCWGEGKIKGSPQCVNSSNGCTAWPVYSVKQKNACFKHWISWFLFAEYIFPWEQLGGSCRCVGGRPSKLQKQNPAYFMLCVSSYQLLHFHPWTELCLWCHF